MRQKVVQMQQTKHWHCSEQCIGSACTRTTSGVACGMICVPVSSAYSRHLHLLPLLASVGMILLHVPGARQTSQGLGAVLPACLWCVCWHVMDSWCRLLLLLFVGLPPRLESSSCMLVLALRRCALLPHSSLNMRCLCKMVPCVPLPW